MGCLYSVAWASLFVIQFLFSNAQRKIKTAYFLTSTHDTIQLPCCIQPYSAQSTHYTIRHFTTNPTACFVLWFGFCYIFVHCCLCTRGCHFYYNTFQIKNKRKKFHTICRSMVQTEFLCFPYLLRSSRCEISKMCSEWMKNAQTFR